MIILAGIVLFIIVFIRVLYMYYQKKKKEGTLKDATLRARNTANSLGMDGDAVAAGILQGTAEESNAKCLKIPRVDGSCAYPLTLSPDTGCCILPPGEEPSRALLVAGVMKDIGIGMLAGVFIDAMLTAALKKGSQTAAARAAAQMAVRAATAAKAGAGATRMGVAAAKVASASGKAAAYGSNAAVMAAGGPVGLAVFVITTSFDIISMTLDLADTAGYSSYTSNGALMRMKAVYDYNMETALKAEEKPYPMLFPLGLPFPDELDAAMGLTLSEIAYTHLKTELLKPETDPQLATAFLEWTMEPDETVPIPDSILEFMALIPNRYPKERDQLISKHMKDLLKPQGKDDWITHFPSLSTANRIAVTFTQKGVREWNSASRQTWFDNNDMFKPVPADPDSPGEPMVALWSDTYDSWTGMGTADKPDMVSKTIPVKVALAFPYGPLVSFCEKTRKVKESSQSINPYDFGARFSYETGVCKFTRTLCSRYGLDYKNNDCKKRPGQGTAEVIFGETITRAFITAFTTPPSYAKKSRLGKKGPCPEGTRDDGTSCWTYTYDRGVGVIPNRCSGDRDEIAGLCYPKCRSDERREGLRCLENCPSGTRDNTAAYCYKSIDVKDGDCQDRDIFGTCTKHRPCDEGWEECKGLGKIPGWFGSKKCCRRRPDSSWELAPEAAGFKYKKIRRNRGLTPIGKTGCNSNREYQDGMCYKRCTDRGTIKYRGMATMCSPEGGAGIHKNLFQRTISKWEDYKPHGGICYKECKPGEKDDGLFCNPMQPN